MYSNQKQLVTIVNITKNPLSFCTARQMDVTVRTKSGTLITVPWADMPCMGTSLCPSKPTTHFAFFWHYGKIGLPAVLIHGNDSNFNYLEPVSS